MFAVRPHRNDNGFGKNVHASPYASNRRFGKHYETVLRLKRWTVGTGMYQWGATISAIDAPAPVLRLDVAPPESARIALPTPFAPRFAIFADAEEEFDWSCDFRRDATATEAIDRLPDANRFFVSRGCIPTYLVDWPVVANPISAHVMAQMVSDGACDIGTQLHPWVNPPFDEALTTHNSYAGNLPVSLHQAKLDSLTGKIEAETGVRPLVYRAGRYGVGKDTGRLLAESGYRLDVSVRSHFDYRAQGGPDFSDHPIWPWRVAERLCAVPLTTTFTGLLRSRGRLPRFERLHGPLARCGIIDRVPLTPEGVRLSDALHAIDRLVDDGHGLFSLSFHTPSIVPGNTPYVRDAADLKRFWAWWDGIFAALDRHGVKPIRSGEIIAAFDGL